MNTEDCYNLDLFAANIHEIVEKYADESDSEIKITVKLPATVTDLFNDSADYGETNTSDILRGVILESESVNRLDINAGMCMQASLLNHESSRYLTCKIMPNYWVEFKKTAKRLQTSIRILMTTILLKRNNLLPQYLN